MDFHYKEVIGSALPADDVDEMDATFGEIPKQPTEIKNSKNQTLSASAETPGLTLVTKLLFFGVIIGVVLAFLRSRKGSVQQKSLA